MNRRRTFVASTKGRLRPFFLPPYSAELNLYEQIWAEVKQRSPKKMGSYPKSVIAFEALRLQGDGG